jgi:IS605 OrfB family transposase
VARQDIIRSDEWLLSGNDDLRRFAEATSDVYRAYVLRLCHLVQPHWPTIGKLSAAEQPLAVERLFNRTKANPAPKYARIFEARPEFAKLPSYLRRAGIRAAIGQVSSFLTRYDGWQSRETRRHNDDRPPRFGIPNVWPVFYTANGGAGAMAQFQGDACRLKLWNGKDWVWVSAVVVRRGRRHQGEAAGVPQSPTLRISEGRVVLTQPFEMPRYCRLGDREVVCSVDLGIHKRATAAIVGSDGSVRGRAFFARTQHDDRRDTAAQAIRTKARATMGGGAKRKAVRSSNTDPAVEAIMARAWKEVLHLAETEIEVSAERLGAILGKAKREAVAEAKRLRSGSAVSVRPDRAGRLLEGFCKGLYRRLHGLNLAIARETAQGIMAFAEKHGATIIVFERLKRFRPKVGGPKGGTMKQRFHAWLHRMLVKQVEASWTERGGKVVYVTPWGTSAWAYDGSGKVVRPVGEHDRAVFGSGKIYDADLNAAYNIGAKFWVAQLAKVAPLRAHLAMILGWDDASIPDQNGVAAQAPPQLPSAQRKKGGAEPGKSNPRTRRGPGTAPRTPATLSTLWQLAKGLQGETPTRGAQAA